MISPRSALAALALAIVLLPAAGADAQTLGAYSAMFTPYIGLTAGGDADDAGFAGGASLAVVQDNGWGVELDLARTSTVGDEGFDDSGLITGMVSAMYMLPRTKVQPFGVLGIGVMRLSGAINAEGARANHTDLAMTLGGGVHVPLNALVGIRGDVRYLRFLDDQPDVPPGKGYFQTFRFAVGVTLNWPLEP